MAEKRSAMKSRKSPRKIPGKVQFSEVNSEDSAQRRAALENALRKKIETEKRALQVVERLLEDDITEDFLTDCAKFISPSYYKDIIEERSIIKLCGYPVCNKRLENVPKQKYKISTKTNKVYDITERKCFCSNFCYRASKYYEAQIPKTPVWSREEESPPVIQLLKEGRSGSSGEEVILIDRHIKMSEVEKPERRTEGGGLSGDEEDGECEPVFVSSVIAEPSPKDMDGGDVTRGETPEMAAIDRDVDDTTEKMSRCSLNDHEKSCDPQRSQDTDTRLGSEESAESAEVVTEVTRRAVSKSGAERLRKLLCKSKSYEATRQADVSPIVVKENMLHVLTRTLNQWRTEDTLKYLFGTDYVVAAAAAQRPDLDEDDLEDMEDSSSSSSVDVAALDESLSYENNSSVSKPLPDYAKLREETNLLETRVREFFGGHYVLPEEVEREPGDRKEKKEVTSWAPPLPLVDSCSQQQVRRGIVLEKLKKVLPAILKTLQLSYSDVSKELHHLVKTFRFTNTNISHTLPEWSIIAIVLLSVLLPTMPLHKDSEQNPLYTQFVSKLLEEFHFQRENLECLKRSFSSRTLSVPS